MMCLMLIEMALGSAVNSFELMLFSKEVNNSILVLLTSQSKHDELSKLYNYFWFNHFSILKIFINIFFLKGKYYLGTHMKPLCRKITSSIKDFFYLRWNESFSGFFGNALLNYKVNGFYYKRSTILKPSDHLFTELSKNSTNTRFHLLSKKVNLQQMVPVKHTVYQCLRFSISLSLFVKRYVSM